MLALYAMSGQAAKACTIRGTLSLALGIGRAIGAARRAQDPFAALLGFLRGTEYYRHCRILFDGKIVDLRRERSAAGRSATC